MNSSNQSWQRRRVLKTGVALAGAAMGHALAQSSAAAFPSRPVRIVVGYPPGQTVDVTARAYAVALQEAWHQPVVVENLAGANGIIGARVVKAAAPDGHTLLFGTSGQLAINPATYRSLPYATLKDFVPVALGAIGRLNLVGSTALPVSSLKQLIAYAKSHPGKLSYGSGGSGITAHLAMEMLKAASGIDMLHVPYKGSPAAINGLLANDVQLMFDAGSLILPQLRAGKIKPLAVSSDTRFAGLPNVPTVAEQGFPGFRVATWSALVAPAGTPAPLVEQINAAMRAASRMETVASAIRAGGSEPKQASTSEFSSFLASELTLWAQAARRANVELQ